MAESTQMISRMEGAAYRGEETSADRERKGPNETDTDEGSRGLGMDVVRGGAWNLGGQTVALLASLASTPFVIRLLGTEGYGLLALVNLAIGYLAFADLGMGTASTRFGAMAHARGDDSGEASVVWTALLVSVVPIALAAGGLWLSAPLVTRLLEVPEALERSAIFALRLASIALVARIVTSVVNTPQLVRMRLDVAAWISMGSALTQAVGIPIVLAFGGGLTGAVGVLVMIGLLTAAAHSVASTYLLPSLRKPRFDISLLPSITRFGAGVAVSSAIGMVLINGEKLILPHYSSVAVLAHYTVAYSVAGLLQIIPSVLSQVLLPAFSRLLPIVNPAGAERLYLRSVRAILIWLSPAALLVCVVAEPFLTIWAGAEFGRESLIPLYVLIGGTFFYTVGYVPYCHLIALGKTSILARYHALELVFFIVAAIFLIKRFGAVGAAMAWAIRAAVDTGLLFRLTHRSTGYPAVGLIRGWVAYAVAMAVLFVPFALIESDAVRALVTGLSLPLYVVIVWLWVMNPEERRWSESSIAAVRTLASRWTRAAFRYARQ